MNAKFELVQGGGGGLYSAGHGQSPVREAGVDPVQGPLLTDRQTHTTENITLATPSSDSKKLQPKSAEFPDPNLTHSE